MEAHNGISAKIVQETGFKGIWGSGLTISASMGVRDNNEASWTQVLDVVEFMSDATDIPILLDGDTGYGNFNNMRRLVKKLEQIDVAAVCIEDKLFPKTNSFISGENQPLADIDEFCGKIKAAKDAQQDEDFMVIARLEAFIAGWGLDEALKRAEAYKKAGADAILCHSKRADSSDIDNFMKEWGNEHPVVLVPTKYYSTPTEKFEKLKINLVIWANHNMRAAVDIMQKTSKQIFKDKSLKNIEPKVTPLGEIFRLQNAPELQEAEKKYLPTKGKKINAIILAAAQGDRFGELTKEIPKAMLTINNKTILGMQVEAFNKVGIKEIHVVRGYKKDTIKPVSLIPIDNDIFDSTAELYSLSLCTNVMNENTVVSFGDIIFKDYILHDLMNDNNDITIVADAGYVNVDDYHEFISTDKPYSRNLYSQTVKLKKMSPKLSKNERTGEFIGLFKVNEKGAEIMKAAINILSKKKDFKKMKMQSLFTEMSKEHPIAVKFIKDTWMDIDTIVDLQRAGEV